MSEPLALQPTESAGDRPAPRPVRVNERPPGRLEAWLERRADRLNPIVVKEIRQGLRTKVFWVCFALMLFACLVISLIAFAMTRGGQDASGPEFFTAFFVCLGVVQFFVIPYSAYRSLAKEREEETWVLLTLTGLSPRRILRGKLVSFLVQAALYGSAAGPFVLFSYYLNGIDLPTILAVLLLGWAYQVFLTAVAVSAATLAEHKLLRAVVHFGLLFALVGATGLGLSVAVAIVGEGRSAVRDDDFLMGLAAALWAMLSYGLLLFEAAAARLSLPTESYAKGPRLAFLVQLLGTAALLFGVWLHEKRDEDVVIGAQVLFCLHLSVVGLFVATDADGMANRFRPGTHAFSLLRPGALRGFRLVMASLLVTSLLWLTLATVSDGNVDEDGMRVLISGGAYVALYLSLPVALSRLLPYPALRSPMVTRLMFLALLLLGAGVPPLVSAIALGEPDDPALNLFSPVLGIANFGDGKMEDGGLAFLCAVAVLAAFAADRALAAKDAEAT